MQKYGVAAVKVLAGRIFGGNNMFLNDKEEAVIGTFLSNLDEYEFEEMELTWENGGKIVANYVSNYEDSNDKRKGEEGYEEYTSFVFDMIDVTGEPPVFISEQDGFCMNYHNFPSEITVDGTKIN